MGWWGCQSRSGVRSIVGKRKEEEFIITIELRKGGGLDTNGRWDGVEKGENGWVAL